MGEENEAKLLHAPQTIKTFSTDIVNPFMAEPTAVALGQQMMVNTSEGLPQNVTVTATKARQRREAKEQQLLAAERTWAEDNSLKEAEKALPIYLNALQMRTGGTTDVNISEFSLMKPEKTVPLIENAALRLVTGRRYGLVGRNGVGKTTLLRAIARYQIPEFPAHLRVLHVEQEIRGGEETALQCVMEADLERTMLLKEEVSLREEVNTVGSGECVRACVRA